MTFEAFETSARGGKPTHLFLFGRQSLVWRFAACDRDVTIGGKTYTAAPISRSEIKQTLEQPQDKVTITFPYNRDPGAEAPVTQALGDNWFPTIPADPITVSCMATHLDDPDAEIDVEWIGLAAVPKFTDGKIELACVPDSQVDRARRQGAKWQVACWKTVYSTGIRGCNLIPTAIPVVGTLTAISGNDVTAAEFTAQQRTFVGGVATWMDGATPRSANITAENGTTLTLDDATGLAVGSVVTAHTIALDVAATLDTVSGLTLTADAFANSSLSLAGGQLFWTSATGLIKRLSIMEHSGTSITLLSGDPDLAIGLAVTARPSCERTWAACGARNNADNYGGAIYEPLQNPYSGTSMSWT